MFQTPVHRTNRSSLFGMVEVTYYAIVRGIRSGHRSAVIALLLNILQGFVMLAAFAMFFLILGLRSSPVRGEMILYLISGILVYITHIKTVSAVMGAGSPTSPMILHRPLNTLILIVSRAVSVLYSQIVMIMSVLLIYHIAINPITIDKPVRALFIFLLAWLTGCGVGLLFLAIQPWFPRFTAILRTVYIRVNMIASGKMFLVNTLPASMIAMFDWNPLFHIIDQIRGATFLHYNPQFTNLEYPLYVALALIMIGLMGEFFSRQHVSISWSAGR